MSLWSGALLVLAASAPQTADDPAAILAERARAVEAQGDALARIWPGYWPPDQPFILYLPGTGAAYGGEAARNGRRFRPGEMEDVRFTFVLDYPSEADNTILLRLDSAEEELSTLFHEQFHDYQSDAFRWLDRGGSGGEFVDVSAIPDLEAFAVAAEQERRLLYAALGPVTPEERLTLVHRYLAARERRLADLPSPIRNIESHMEWNEGTAEYAALRAMTVMEPGGPSMEDRVRERLARSLLRPGSSYVGDVFRGRAYGTGAAMIVLLEDLGAANWRRRIERGEPLLSLLAEAAGERPSLPPEPVDDAVREDIRRQMTLPPGAVAEPVSVADFLSRSPDWLVVRFEGPVRRSRPVGLSFGARGMTPLPGGALALQDVREVLAEFDGARIETRGRPVMIQEPVGPTRVVATTLYIALSEGERARLVSGERVFELENLRLELPPHAVIGDVDGRRTIRVIAAP